MLLREILFSTICVVFLTLSLINTTVCCLKTFESKTLLIKARLDEERLIKLLFLNNTIRDSNVRETYVTTNSITIDQDRIGSERNLRIIASYRLWYNPNYIITIGEYNNEYIFMQAFEYILDNTYPTGRLNEVIYSELGLLLCIGVITDLVEIVETTPLVLDERFYQENYLNKTIYSRPAWEKELISILRNSSISREPYPEQSIAQSDTWTITENNSVLQEISSSDSYREYRRVEFQPILYAFIIASLLSILVYFIYKII
ncbi:MAG: hypothetical protein QXU89_01920 [Desulfurococcaceae archaeon]